MTPIWLNGRLVSEKEARIEPSDRGFTLADGLFETIRITDDRLLWISDHLSRLRSGARTLGIPVPLADAEIIEGLRALVTASAMPDCALRLSLTRGPSAKRGLWPPSEPATPTLIATIASFAETPPAVLVVANATRRNEHSPLSRLKSLSYGDNILAKREAIERGATDALLLNCRGDLACCTVGNLFLQIKNRWATPQLSDGILPGLARARVVQMTGAEERTISADELKDVTEAFITNSLQTTPVLQLDGRQLSPPSLRLDKSTLYKDPGGAPARTS
ncbi:MAG: aminotransferase class IV [Beijerinckiaceae bacterium]|jgi:branched-chain amino acid aminotransferase/4-amino-4-deoxychorismate lyase